MDGFTYHNTLTVTKNSREECESWRDSIQIPEGGKFESFSIEVTQEVHCGWIYDLIGPKRYHATFCYYDTAEPE
jgi:hypothetical protein